MKESIAAKIGSLHYYAEETLDEATEGNTVLSWTTYPEVSISEFREALFTEDLKDWSMVNSLLDCPFKIFTPFSIGDGTAKDRYNESNLPTHFFQVLGTIYSNDRQAILNGESVTGVPDWTYIRDNAIYLNVNNIDVAKQTAADIGGVYIEETLVVDATYGNGTRDDVQKHPGLIINGCGDHNSKFLYEIMYLIRMQETKLHEYLLRDLTATSAMRFISESGETICDGLVDGQTVSEEKTSYLYKGTPNWFIRAKYYTEYMQSGIQRNWRNIVIVGAAKKIATGDFKPAKLFQWLASMGRVNCKVIFLD